MSECGLNEVYLGAPVYRVARVGVPEPVGRHVRGFFGPAFFAAALTILSLRPAGVRRAAAYPTLVEVASYPPPPG